MPINLYLTEPEEWRSEYSSCLQKVKWNIREITGNEDADGFLVQRVSIHRSSDRCEDRIPEYYEAWKVEKGLVLSENAQYDYDDCLMIGSCKDDAFDAAELECSIREKRGTVRFDCVLCWVDISQSELYQYVSSWERNNVYAGRLRSKFSSPSVDKKFASVSQIPRPKFEHHWELTEDNIIYEAAHRILRNLFNDNLYKEIEKKNYISMVNSWFPDSSHAAVRKRLLDDMHRRCDELDQ